MLTVEDKKVIEKWFSGSDLLECEVRIGNFGDVFDTNISADVFYRVQENLGKYYTWKEINIDERVVNDVKYRTENGVTQGVKKERVIQSDNKDFDYRVSLMREVKVDGVYGGVGGVVRKKKRWMYRDELLSFDLTIVNGNEYQIEMELIRGGKLMDYYDILNKRVYYILQLVQDNFKVLNRKGRLMIMERYKEMTGVNYFVGAQAEALTKDNLKMIYNEEYGVTPKIDGDRCLLMVSNKSLYMMDNNLKNIKDISIKVDIDDCLLDGELLKSGGKFVYYAFDVLYYKCDLRGNNRYDLRVRLDIVDVVLRELMRYNNDMYTFKGKEYYIGTVALGCKLISSSRYEYKMDGLIFTPVADAYPLRRKCSKLLKWKSVEDVTIDFYSVNVGGDKWKLYVQAPIRNGEYKSDSKTVGKVLFDVSKLMNEKVLNVSFETYFKNEDGRFISNSVIEYKYSRESCLFVPIRMRWDKSLDVKKHGNYYKVACDLWSYIQNPISIDKLTTTNIVYNMSRDDVYFKDMRDFHNVIKRDMYNKYTRNTKSLLELCSGRGGDIKKWLYNNIEFVDGYDIDEYSIEECRKRYVELKGNRKVNYRFTKCDVRKMLFNSIVYDNIVCHFGLHYLYNDMRSFENLMLDMYTKLKVGGVFICTVLDSVEVLKRPMNIRCDNRKVIMYYKYFRETKRIMIYLNGNNYLSFNNEECVIDKEALINACCISGIEILESVLFSDLPGFDELSDVEKCISSLYRYYVFRKKSDNTETRKCDVKMYKSISKSKEINVGNGLSLIKVDSLYDTLRFLNYKELYYNKYKYKNVNIDEVDWSLLSKHNVVFFNKVILSDGCTLLLEPYLYNNDSKSTVKLCKIVKRTESDSYDNYYIVLEDSLLEYETSLEEIMEVNTDSELVKVDSSVIENLCDDVSNISINPLFERMKVSELRDILRTRGMSISGTKQVLIDRLRGLNS